MQSTNCRLNQSVPSFGRIFQANGTNLALVDLFISKFSHSTANQSYVNSSFNMLINNVLKRWKFKNYTHIFPFVQFRVFQTIRYVPILTIFSKCFLQFVNKSCENIHSRLPPECPLISSDDGSYYDYALPCLIY